MCEDEKQAVLAFVIQVQALVTKTVIEATTAHFIQSSNTSIPMLCDAYQRCTTLAQMRAKMHLQQGNIIYLARRTELPVACAMLKAEIDIRTSEGLVFPPFGFGMPPKDFGLSEETRHLLTEEEKLLFD